MQKNCFFAETFRSFVLQ